MTLNLLELVGTGKKNRHPRLQDWISAFSCGHSGEKNTTLKGNGYIFSHE